MTNEQRPVEKTLFNKLDDEVNKFMLKKYNPPGVVVNDEYDIMQFRGDTSEYLVNPPGSPIYNVVKMAKPLLAIKLQKALKKVMETNEAQILENMYVDKQDENSMIDVTVTPLHTKKENERFFLILFNANVKEKPSIETHQVAEDVNEEIKRLRDELSETKEYLQNYMEESESYNEELSSANEELQSSYEELQSMNEELETTKEELQASNEELTTLNEELQSRNTELNQLYNDLNNFVNSSNISMIIIGLDMRIRRTTPKASELLNVRPVDVGRPLKEINLEIDIPDLDEILQETIEDLSSNELELPDKNGKWYSIRIRPYRTEDRRVEGAVLTFIDIDEIIKSYRYSNLVNSIISHSSDVIIVVDADGKIKKWSNSAELAYGYTKDEALGADIEDLLSEKEADIIELYEKAKIGERFVSIPSQGTDQTTHELLVLPLEDKSGLINEIVIIRKDHKILDSG